MRVGVKSSVKADRNVKIRLSVPFEHDGRQKLNRQARRAATSRLRQAGIDRDPLTTLLRSRRAVPWLLGGVLLCAAILYVLYLLNI
jgi:hypothetical protein